MHDANGCQLRDNHTRTEQVDPSDFEVRSVVLKLTKVIVALVVDQSTHVLDVVRDLDRSSETRARTLRLFRLKCQISPVGSRISPDHPASNDVRSTVCTLLTVAGCTPIA